MSRFKGKGAGGAIKAGRVTPTKAIGVEVTREDADIILTCFDTHQVTTLRWGIRDARQVMRMIMKACDEGQFAPEEETITGGGLVIPSSKDVEKLAGP